jgi:hypothetical protein
MQKKPDITLENKRAFEDALDELRQGQEILALMTNDYPVICVIDDQKFVFKKRKDVKELIEVIGDSLGRVLGKAG